MMLEGMETPVCHCAPFPDVAFSFEVVDNNQVENNILSKRVFNHHTRKV